MWAPGALPEGAAVLSRLTNFVRQSPGSTIVGSNYQLARWSLGVSATIDEQRRLAVVGTVREMPERLDPARAARLAGDFALISCLPKGLLLARGRHAGRCLYYARLSGGMIAVCSRLAPLVACLGGQVTPNVQTLAALMLREPCDDLTATVFPEVHRVEASEAILLTDSGIEESARAAMEVVTRDGSPEELAEEIRNTTDRAVRRALGSMRRVAVLVSGGLDSSTVLARSVAIARGANRMEVDAVTWSFAGPGDDRPYLTELCESLGIVPLRISTADAAPSVVRGLVADAAPSIWATVAGLLLPQEKARERGAEAILTGMGGDYIFNGDPRVLAQYAKGGEWGKAVRAATQLLGDSPPRAALRMARLLISPAMSAIPASLRVRRRRFATRRWAWAGPHLRRLIANTYVRQPENQDWCHRTSEVRFQRFVSRDFLHIAETRGQMEAATGLMRIDPLLDDELVSTVAGMPQAALLFGNRYRGLLRHAMRQSLPERLRMRPDKARFGPVVAELIKSSDVGALRSLASMRLSGDLGLVEPRMYAQHFEAALRAGSDAQEWPALWPALSVEAFLRSRWGQPSKEEE